MKNKKLLYILAMTAAISSTAVGMAVAGYNYGELYGYEDVAKNSPRPGVYATEEQAVAHAMAGYEASSVEVETIPAKKTANRVVMKTPKPTVSAVPAPDKDGSLFPGGKCPNCDKEDKDGSLFPGGSCKRCTKRQVQVPGPCQRCQMRQVQYVSLRNQVPYTPVIPEAVQANCCQMAPIALDHVDFRITGNNKDGYYNNKLGNYRFRIFGCRRTSKEARLNSGRILEKNINFHAVFEESVDDCYKVLPMPKDLCLQTKPVDLPEYVLTAEITDYFMNVCDEYDWKKVEKKNTRTGTSEITVVWRLMDLSKNKVYWKGESTGYGELFIGEPDGEVKLIERAFADATSNLRSLTGFENQLMQRFDAITMNQQKNAVIEEERAINPIKCGYLKEYECVKNCQLSRPGADLSHCCTPCAAQPNEVCEMGEVITESTPIDNCVDENGKLIENGACYTVDDTWIDTGDVKSLDNLCIVDANPCQELTPETIYRMRSSIVQIDSPNGRKGAGLLISDRYILTSGDLIDRENNTYNVRTVRNVDYKARAIRYNPSKNTALLMLEQSVEYTPLALNLSLPEVGCNGFLTLGVLDVKDFKSGQDYLENSARIEGYRYTEEKGAEIMANTFIQNVTVGGALFYKNCTVSGMAQSGVRTDSGLDAYVPTETALRSLGISICGHEYVAESPWQQTVYKPVTEQITIIQTAPEAMKPQERK